ncbi:hypothetical protein [Butyrivibrio sp. INlla16]|uniref:hypothetical protein n=1 Tax=Butyrivibrio sp. INlla16 TaxID=1520807 RepID=UPI000886F465|nr:hypothetical protein [Butyrivibrio sp. INlla16]SDB21593.1 hypothetical protein SAMN02910263_01031 [Butyrivibrio sp. INlla16]
MSDRRNNERIQMYSSALVYIEGYDAEIEGIVTNLSEENIGLKCRISDELKKKIEDSKMITFQFVDTYLEGKKAKTDVVQACALIQRMEYSDGECFIGGVVRDENFKRYVLRRKLSPYYK